MKWLKDNIYSLNWPQAIVLILTGICAVNIPYSIGESANVSPNQFVTFVSIIFLGFIIIYIIGWFIFHMKE